jgi:hypothetical protein
MFFGSFSWSFVLVSLPFHACAPLARMRGRTPAPWLV